MKSGKLLTLVVVALIVCATAVVLYRSQETAGGSRGSAGLARGDLLLPKISGQVESIARVEFQQGADRVAIVRGDGDTWKVETRGNYPANPKQLQRLMVDLTELRVGERVTSNPEKYATFKVTNDAPEKGTLWLKDKSGADLARILFGAERQTESAPESMARGGGRYVRVGDDPAVYTVNDEDLYWLKPAVSEWVETEIAKIPKDDIVAVSVDHGTTESFKAVWMDGKPKLDPLDKGMKEKEWELTSARGALEDMRLENVHPADSEVVKGVDWPVTYTAEQKDGISYVAKVTSGAVRLVALSARPTVALPEIQDDGTTASKEAAARVAKLRATIDAFNTRHSPWVYELSTWTFDKFNRKRSAAMEKLPEEKKDDATAESKEPKSSEAKDAKPTPAAKKTDAKKTTPQKSDAKKPEPKKASPPAKSGS